MLEAQGKKGKTTISIHDQAGVDWFMRKFMDPVTNSASFQKHERRKAELQAQGLMPKTLEGHLENLELERAVGAGGAVELAEGETLLATDE